MKRCHRCGTDDFQLLKLHDGERWRLVCCRCFKRAQGNVVVE